MSRKIGHLLLACLVIGLPLIASGQDRQTPASGKNSAAKKEVASPKGDAEKLDDLDNQLLEGLGDLPELPTPAKNQGKPASGAPGNNEGAEKPGSGKLDQKGAGEDIELGPKADPLKRIGEKMRVAGELISARETSSRTQQLQEQIVEELSALISAAQKQRSRSSRQNKSSGQGGADGQQQDPNADKPPLQGEKPARQSTERLGKDGKQGALALIRGPEGLLKEFWGDLPEKVRRQMQSVTSEQFLPKYEKLIQRYYKRLAEEGRNQP